jgi:hypothetical protein
MIDVVMHVGHTGAKFTDKLPQARHSRRVLRRQHVVNEVLFDLLVNERQVSFIKEHLRHMSEHQLVLL